MTTLIAKLARDVLKHRTYCPTCQRATTNCYTQDVLLNRWALAWLKAREGEWLDVGSETLADYVAYPSP